MRTARGISLITVMILIAILAVIAAFAIPAWRNHLARNRVENALKATEAAKLVVMEAATIHGGLDHLNASELGFSSAATPNPYVAGIAIADGGRITLTTKSTGASKDPVLLLIPSESAGDRGTSRVTWRCTMVTGSTAATPAACHSGQVTGIPEATPAKVKTAAGDSPTRPS